MTADLDARTTNLGTGTGSFAKAFVAALPAGRTLAASYAGTMIALTESTDTKPRQQHPGNVLRRSDRPGFNARLLTRLSWYNFGC